MKLRLILNNYDGLTFIASMMQHYGIVMTSEWASAALADCQNPFVDIDLGGLRRDQVELRPQGWRDRLALLRRALS